MWRFHLSHLKVMGRARHTSVRRASPRMMAERSGHHLCYSTYHQARWPTKRCGSDPQLDEPAAQSGDESTVIQNSASWWQRRRLTLPQPTRLLCQTHPLCTTLGACHLPWRCFARVIGSSPVSSHCRPMPDSSAVRHGSRHHWHISVVWSGQGTRWSIHMPRLSPTPNKSSTAFPPPGAETTPLYRS